MIKIIVLIYLFVGLAIGLRQIYRSQDENYLFHETNFMTKHFLILSMMVLWPLLLMVKTNKK